MICMFSATFSSFAQIEHRISYTFGFVSHAYHTERANERKDKEYIFPGNRDHGTYEYTDEDLHSIPVAFNFQYDCSLKKHFGVGLCIGYELENMYQKTNVVKSKKVDITSPFGNTYTDWEQVHSNGELKRHILYIMPEATGYWFKKRHVAMYSKVAAGLRIDFERREFYESIPKSFIQPKKNRASVYFQVSPVAVEVGGPYWRGNIEIGYGAQGVFQYGVRHIFKGKEKSENNIVELSN